MADCAEKNGYHWDLFPPRPTSPLMPRASASDATSAAAAPPASFEAALAELETLVADLEGGQLPLADALTAYRRGALLLQYAQGQLQGVQEQVKILEGDVLKNFSEPDGGQDA